MWKYVVLLDFALPVRAGGLLTDMRRATAATEPPSELGLAYAGRPRPPTSEARADCRYDESGLLLRRTRLLGRAHGSVTGRLWSGILRTSTVHVVLVAYLSAVAATIRVSS